MNHVDNTIYLRRRSKVCLPVPAQKEVGQEALLPLNYVASMLKNIESLGFAFSEPLIAECRALSLDQLTDFYNALVIDLRKAKGAHQSYLPMYPNFPAQVMEMSRAQLYFNSIVHYLTDGKLFPKTELRKRFPLLANVDLQIIECGDQEEFERLFGQIAGSNTSLSEQDKEDLAWFVSTYGEDSARLLPDTIPQKENVAAIAVLLVAHTQNPIEFVQKFCRTATDILRLAVAMSEGDVSLALPAKFRSFKRAERGLLLGLLERQTNPTEDMLRWKDRWIRLGERLHPGEYKRKYPQTAEAFNILRNDLPFETFNRRVEKALADRKVNEAVADFAARPGDFARRLDHLLRIGDTEGQDAVAATFAEVAPKVATPVLLQVRQHFIARNSPMPLRVFLPKGNVAKAYAVENTLPALTQSICERVVIGCENALMARFRPLSPLGKVFVDEALSHFMIPFAARSASRSFRTLARGSRLPLPADCKTLRFFVWWKNGKERTDIDLSAALFDQDFHYNDIISYYNLKNYGGCHSGDIVDAPRGASEFIDISLEKAIEMKVRYIVMTLTSYTHQPYCDLPECFAGWMAREIASSGEIYEPKTVQDRLDITADTKIAIPLILDIVENRVIWCDMALKRNPIWVNNVDGNLKGINLTLQSMTQLNKPNLHDLFVLHARARGELVETQEEAETVFSVADGLPFRQDEIASEYLA